MTFKEYIARAKADLDRAFEEGKNQGGGGSNFWEEYQQLGNRVDYRFAFAGEGWDDISFVPKYDLKPTLGQYMFNVCKITDLKGFLEANGLVLDTSECTNCQNMFYQTNITRLPILDLRKSTSLLNFMGYSHSLVSIDGIYLPTDVDTSNSFNYLNALEYIRFENDITKSVNVKPSTKLTAESIDNILSHLGGSSTNTLTLPTTARATYDAFYGDGAFEIKVNARPSNWTIAY